MGAIDATVNLILSLLPSSLLLPGLFIAACFISLSIGTSVGTVIALVPIALGLGESLGLSNAYVAAVVTGGRLLRRQPLVHLRHDDRSDPHTGL